MTYHIDEPTIKPSFFLWIEALGWEWEFMMAGPAMRKTDRREQQKSCFLSSANLVNKHLRSVGSQDELLGQFRCALMHLWLLPLLCPGSKAWLSVRAIRSRPASAGRAKSRSPSWTICTVMAQRTDRAAGRSVCGRGQSQVLCLWEMEQKQEDYFCTKWASGVAKKLKLL